LFTVKSITEIIEQIAPKNLALNWDNVGLQIGSLSTQVKRILLCLDVNEQVINEAIERDVQLIISHHPLIFSPIKNVTTETYKGNLIIKAIENKLNIYVAHTNIDGSEGGLNSYIAGLLNLQNTEVIDPIGEESLYKIAVFIPEGHEEIVSNELSRAGAGHIGNYSHCTFRTHGEGTFKPLEGTNPFIGEINKIECVKEIRLETIVKQRDLHKAVDAMLKAHPYEEVAYDVYKLSNIQSEKNGIGRVGELEQPVIFRDFIEHMKNVFNTKHLKVTGMIDETIKRVAVVNGSGAEYISKAAKLNCDLLITGDVKYHDAQMAEELNLKIIDVGHYESEIFFIDLLNDYLSEQFKKHNIQVEVISSCVNGNPFTII